LLFHFQPSSFSIVTTHPWQLVLCCLEAWLLKGGALSCPVSHLHFPIHFHSFPFIPTTHSHFPLFISFSVHSPVSDSYAHVSRLLSMLWVLYISCVLVLDRSRLIPMCYCFTHLSYPFHTELCPLSHVVCFHAPDLCSLLLSHGFASIYFQLSFLLYYLDNCVCYLVLQSLDQPSHCPITQFPCSFIYLPPRVCSFSSTPPSQVIVSSSTVMICHPSRTILIIKSSSVQTPVLLSWTSGLLFHCPGLTSIPSTWLST